VEALAGIMLGAVVFMQAWQLFGLSAPRTTGTVGALGAVALVVLAAWQPVPTLTASTNEAVATSFLVWATYAALVAAVGLWEVEDRGLGLYGVFGLVIMIGQIIYGLAIRPSAAATICGLVQGAAFLMLFLYLGLAMAGLRRVTAWVLLVAGVVHVVLAALLLMGGLT
jgi:hypothetical protein